MNKKTTDAHQQQAAAVNVQQVIKHAFKWLILLALLSICVGSVAAFFLHSLDWVTQFREQQQWIIAFLPLAGLAIGLLYHYYGKEVAAGNQILIHTLQHPETSIPFKMAPLIYTGTIITHLFGGSAGREGTALQMAASIADLFTNPFKLTAANKRIFILSAVAAGFGSVFGTPWAGAVFAVEFVFAKRVQYNAILPVLLASFGAHYIAQVFNAPHTTYFITSDLHLSGINLLYTILAGCAFGIGAVLFVLCLKYCTEVFNRFLVYPPLRPFVAGILIALAVWLLGTSQYIGLGIPSIVSSFETGFPLHFFAIKLLFTVVTLSGGFKGGEVTPLFVMGATLGSALSLLIPLPTALLAGMGFVALFAGASKTPITCTIMAIELFGYESAIFIGIACFIAYFVSGKKSIYNIHKYKVA
jgi:H+/Cl- antiporter ClcA